MYTNQKIKNSLILILCIYIKFIISIITLFQIEEYVTPITMLAMLFIFFYALMVNRNMINKKIIFMLLFIVALYVLNVLLVEDKIYVFKKLINFLSYNFVIAYVITNGIDYDVLLEYWYSIAKVLTIVLFIFVILKIINNARYMYIGIYNSYNAIIICDRLFKMRNKKTFNFTLFVVTLYIAFFYGNRSAMISVFFVIMYELFQHMKVKCVRKYVFYAATAFSSILLFLYTDKVIQLALLIISKFNIRTYSVVKYINMLQGRFWEMSSGRDVLYDKALNIITNSDGMPLGVNRFFLETDGLYEYPHNFLLEWFIVFGYILGSILLILLVVGIVRFNIKNKSQKTIRNVFSLFSIFFVSRCMFSGTFLQERSFWILIFIMLAHNVKNNLKE